MQPGQTARFLVLLATLNVYEVLVIIDFAAAAWVSAVALVLAVVKLVVILPPQRRP